MKFKWHNIRFVLLLGVIAFLFGFAKNRNVQKSLTEVVISFDTDQNLLITESSILSELNLLKDSISKIQLNELNLMLLEENLNSNEMLKSAQVYKTINGFLGVEVIQRKPILRFYDNGFHYMDEEGKFMPLSDNYSVRVPVAMGIASTEIQHYYPLALLLNHDEFFKKNIVGFQLNTKGEIILELRDQEVLVNFGRLENEHRKLANFKAFCMKAYKEGLFTKYSKIDLQYGSQVICTKK